MKTIGIVVVAFSSIAVGACSPSSEAPPPRSANMDPTSAEPNPRAHAQRPEPDVPSHGSAGATPPSSWSAPALPAIGGGPRPSPQDREVSDVNPGAAAQQANPMDADQALTDKIRAALQADQELSPAAKNIDIVTIAGRVTLRGTVKSRVEKKAVEGKVLDNAGTAEVDSRLQVKK